MSDAANSAQDGKYEFTMNYSERELTCWVEKIQNQLKVHLDNEMYVDLEIQPDGTVIQTAGPTFSEAGIEFIKKHVLGHEV